MAQASEQGGVPTETSDHAPGTDSHRWPATERREVPWHTNPEQRAPDGRRPSREDRALSSVVAEIPARIAQTAVVLEPDLAEHCRHVEAEITRLDAQFGTGLLGLSSFLIRSESVASSRIEQVYADLDDVARASLAEASSSAAKSIAAAVDAMSQLILSQVPGSPFRESALREAHHTLLEHDRFESSYAGRYRDVQNWIGGSEFSPRNAVHVPAPPSELEALMADLAEFVDRDDPQPLAQAAVAHGQFEAIHPFTDGNGRIGRGLIAMVLRRRGVTRQLVIPIASAMLADVDAYFDSLIAYRHGDAASLVSYLVHAAETATSEASASAQRLIAMPSAWRELARPRANSSTATLIDQLVIQPVLNAQLAQQLTGASAPRTYEAIEKLTEAGVLREITGSARNRVWVVSEVLTEIADLDERIGRRMTPSNRWRT